MDLIWIATQTSEYTHIFDTYKTIGNWNTDMNIYWYQEIIVVFLNME